MVFWRASWEDFRHRAGAAAGIRFADYVADATNETRSESRWLQKIVRLSACAVCRLSGLNTPLITAHGTMARLPNSAVQARAFPTASWLTLLKEFTALFDVLHSTGMARPS